MGAQALAALAALSWGGAGLLAGYVSRSLPAVLVALLAQSAGLVVLLAVALGEPDPPTARALIAGLAGGTVGGLGLLCLYHALSGPSVGVAAPIAACGILVPVLVGVIGGERPDATQAAGAVVLAAGLGAILYAGPGERRDRRAVRLATGAALAFGAFYVALDVGAQDSAAWVTVFARVGGASVLAVLAVRTRAFGPGPDGRGAGLALLGLAVLAGAVDAAGNLAFATASAIGELSVVSLISASYPAVTVVLAVVLLRQRITALRAGGLLATVVGLGLIGT